jgi:hypothetical protein
MVDRGGEIRTAAVHAMALIHRLRVLGGGNGWPELGHPHPTAINPDGDTCRDPAVWVP